MKKEREEILQKIKHHLLQHQEILFAYLLGTFLHQDDFKDIDIVLFLDETAIKTNHIDTFDYEINMSLLLEKEIQPGQAFKRYVPMDVKVVNDAPLGFKYSVSRGVLLFSRDEDAREDFLCSTWREYFDHQIKSEIYLKGVLNAGV
jgi:predicted nucleotidyltransferase